jgi:hypothetical protein
MFNDVVGLPHCVRNRTKKARRRTASRYEDWFTVRRCWIFLLFVKGPIVVVRNKIAFDDWNVVFLTIMFDVPNAISHRRNAIFVYVTAVGAEDRMLFRNKIPILQNLSSSFFEQPGHFLRLQLVLTKKKMDMVRQYRAGITG